MGLHPPGSRRKLGDSAPQIPRWAPGPHTQAAVDAQNPAPLLHVNLFRVCPPAPPDLTLAVDDVGPQAALVQDFDHSNSLLKRSLLVNIKSGGQGGLRAGFQRYLPKGLFQGGAGFRSSTVLMTTSFFDFYSARPLTKPGTPTAPGTPSTPGTPGAHQAHAAWSLVPGAGPWSLVPGPWFLAHGP